MAVVIKLSLIQFLVTLLFSACLLIFLSSLHSISALLGGSICAVANLFFAGKLFFKKEELNPTDTLRHFYRSESLKIAFTLAMFILVYIAIEVEHLVFIVGYSLAAFMNWLSLPFLR